MSTTTTTIPPNGKNAPDAPGITIPDEFTAAMRERDADPLTWPLTLQLTHTGNAARFAARFGAKSRFVPGRGWRVWDGRRWATDEEDAQVMRHMRTIGREWFTEAGKQDDDGMRKAVAKHAGATLTRYGLESSLVLASKERGILACADDFDADPMVLNVQNGIVDLRTCALRDHDPAAMCSRIAGAAYEPAATAPRWQQFLREIFAGDEAMVAFIRKWFGYCLTGETREQRYLVAWGSGQNGKSKLFDAVRAVMGDYSIDISTAALATKHETSNLNTDIARMPGARMAVAPEWDEDMRADETMLKSLSGQDVITVRTLYQKPFNFRPQGKIAIFGNAKPVLRGTDTATWRRPLLVPFTERFEGKRCDATLGDKLAAERDGILADLVRGCIEWQRDGLAIPQRVIDATAEYRRDSDDVVQFLDACCIRNTNARAKVGTLHAAYLTWGGAIKTPRKFGAALHDAGFQTERTRIGFEALGIGLEHTNEVHL